MHALMHVAASEESGKDTFLWTGIVEWKGGGCLLSAHEPHLSSSPGTSYTIAVQQ